MGGVSHTRNGVASHGEGVHAANTPAGVVGNWLAEATVDVVAGSQHVTELERPLRPVLAGGVCPVRRVHSWR